MGVNDPKELYIENDFESLKSRAADAVADKKLVCNSKLSYLNLMDSMHLRIKEAFLQGDQEVEFMYIYRFIQLCTKMASMPDKGNEKNKIKLKKYRENALCHINRLEKLENILKNRYEELQLKKLSHAEPFDLAVTITLPPPVKELGSIKPQKEDVKKFTSNGYIDCKHLYALLNDKVNEKWSLLLIDCRSKEDFQLSQISYLNLIHIPQGLIKRGKSANLLQYAVNEEHKKDWDLRHTYDIVVLLDCDTTEDKFQTDSHIGILQDILLRWDVKGSYKCLVLLDGGFDGFQSMYPHCTTNQNYVSHKRHNHRKAITDTHLAFKSLVYPELFDNVPKPKALTTKNIPVTNGVPKGFSSEDYEKTRKLGYSELKAFTESEKSKEAKKDRRNDENKSYLEDGGEQEDNINGSEIVSTSHSFPDPALTVSRIDIPDRSTLGPFSSPVSMDINDSDTNQPPGENANKENQEDPYSFTEDTFNFPKSILKTKPDQRMSEEEKAAYVESIRKVKPKPPTAMPPEEKMEVAVSSSSDEDESLPLKSDGVGSNMRRSFSSPNIAEAMDDDIMTTPSFTRSNKPSYSQRPSFTPFSHGENMDAVYGRTQCGLTGLKNFANNCYMNSILQCLSNTEALCSELTSLNKPSLNPSSSTKGEIANTLITALRYIWSGEIKVYSIRELKNLMGNYKEIFKGANHQDSHEFLIILLEYLHDDLNNPMKNTILAGANESSGEKAWGEFRQKNHSIIQQLFYGQEQSSVVCRTCSHKSVTFDHFFNLSVPIPDVDRTSIEECIRVYLTGENITWKCPNCKIDRKAVKKLDITRLPPILIIALKRFSQEGQSSWLEKKETLVTYPLENLDMKSLILPGSEQRHTKYNLHALSTHTGTLRTGHYRAICKNHMTSKWYLFDDTAIHSISPQDVRNNPEVYILFYHAVG